MIWYIFKGYLHLGPQEDWKVINFSLWKLVKAYRKIGGIRDAIRKDVGDVFCVNRVAKIAICFRFCKFLAEIF